MVNWPMQSVTTLGPLRLSTWTSCTIAPRNGVFVRLSRTIPLTEACAPAWRDDKAMHATAAKHRGIVVIFRIMTFVQRSRYHSGDRAPEPGSSGAKHEAV